MSLLKYSAGAKAIETDIVERLMLLLEKGINSPYVWGMIFLALGYFIRQSRQYENVNVGTYQGSFDPNDPRTWAGLNVERRQVSEGLDITVWQLGGGSQSNPDPSRPFVLPGGPFGAILGFALQFVPDFSAIARSVQSLSGGFVIRITLSDVFFFAGLMAVGSPILSAGIGAIAGKVP